jgi:hypothetical protein
MQIRGLRQSRFGLIRARFGFLQAESGPVARLLLALLYGIVLATLILI